MRNMGGVDCTGGMSREQRVINRRNKLESSLISRGFKTKGLSYAIKKMKKRQASQEALLAFEMDLRAAEERQFGELPDRAVSNISFEEKSFGSPVAPGQKFCQINAKDTRCDLSSILVSLALFDGDNLLFACSGIPIPRGTTRLHLTRFVTSARLVRAFNENRNRDDKLRVAVRLPDNTITDGFLGLYDDDIAIVTSIGLRIVHPVDMGLRTTRPDNDVLAAGRAFSSGSLMAMHVSLREDTLISDSQGFTEAVIGGPLIGKDERFLGMVVDLYRHGDMDVRYASCVAADILCKCLEHFQIINHEVKIFRGYTLPSGVRTIAPSGFMKTIYRLKSLGYPMPPPLVLEFNGRLLNKFEEHFGELHAWKGYPYGIPPRSSSERVWAQLPKQVVTDISRRVVSLASFNGCVRYFACTGLLINWPGSKTMRTVILTSASLVRSFGGDDIDTTLRIEVFLPPKQRAIGNLEFYNLNYNVAIVSVKKNFTAIRPEDILKVVQTSGTDKVQKSSVKVIAIGRDVQHGLLMASTGEVNRRNKTTKLNCKDIQVSTCKIKKVGIGGPLVNFSGSFVGMNFYDESEVTPFLPRRKIVKVLSRTKDDVLPLEWGLRNPVHIEDEGVGGKTKKNKWPVPEPYWYHGGLDVSLYHVPELIGRVLQ